MQVDTLISASWIIPIEDDSVLKDHSIAIHNGQIHDILPTSTAIERYTATDHHQFDGHAITPGFINAHTHAAMNLLKGLADDLPLMTWLQEHIWPAEGQWLSESFVRDGTQLAVAEMLRSGTTCFNDMYLFPEVAADVARSAGIRACIGLIVIDFPTPWAADQASYFRKGMALHDKLKGDALIKACLAPHAPYTVNDEALSKIAALSAELNLPIHMHIHETAFEVSDALEENGERPLARLKKLGLLGPQTLAVHMTQLNDDDLALCAEHNIHVVHCPESNMKLASGICPVTELRARGINVALGTDGCASNNDLDMIGEMRSAAFLAKVQSGDASSVPAIEALRMATLNGAKALGIDDTTGSLKTGKAADLIAIDLRELETQPNYDPVSTIVYAASRNQVRHSWVNGRQLLKDRQLLTLNEQELIANAATWQSKIASTNLT